MKSETDPVTDDEWLLRRVRVEQFRTDKVPVISPNAFEPRVNGREPDADGISLYRADCLADPSEILTINAPEHQHKNGIVRIPVSMLKSLNLTVEIKTDEQIKGHVVIPELNAADYQSDKARFTPTKLALATEASKDTNIVQYPRKP